MEFHLPWFPPLASSYGCSQSRLSTVLAQTAEDSFDPFLMGVRRHPALNAGLLGLSGSNEGFLRSRSKPVLVGL
eukprot:3247258-Ditylum_brightwellii.AAC.1